MKDWRQIKSGVEIPSLTYSDQPYIIKNDNNTLLCSMTTGKGHEGAKGQKVITLRSLDLGKTWIDIRNIEDETSPENSYSVLLKTNYGRVYCFYNFNKDNIRKIKADNPPYEDGYCYRVDSLGYYAFRYTDDFGISWSKDRYYVNIRNFDIDDGNAYNGEIQFFWNVGKPLIDGDIAYLSLHKVGGFGENFFTTSEGVLIKSSNIMYEKDVNKLMFETLPEGKVGIKAPKGGAIAEEQSYVMLNDGSFFTVFRTVEGRSAYSYSRDKGKTWEKSKYMPIKHPRAANFVWKMSNGKFLYWFHNHGGSGYEGRNPAWCLIGEEKEGIIYWSQPEILIYSDDPIIKISYPDFIEIENEYYVTETEKNIARIHKIDKVFMNKITTNSNFNNIIKENLIIETVKKHIKLPQFKSFTKKDYNRANNGTEDLRQGFTFDFKFVFEDEPIEIFNSINNNEKGIKIEIIERRIVFTMSDGQYINIWKSDVDSLINGINHISIIIDGGPKIIYYIINGKFNDGKKRQYGWGRFSDKFKDFNGLNKVELNSSIIIFRIYDRALLSCEVVSNYMLEKKMEK